MKWCEAKDVLGFEVWFHGQDVVEGHFGSGEAGPMEWSTLF